MQLEWILYTEDYQKHLKTNSWTANIVGPVLSGFSMPTVAFTILEFS